MTIFRSIANKTATKAIANTIYSSINIALKARSSRAGISNSPKRGIKFPRILDFDLSFHLPAMTTMINHKARHRTGKGAISPGGIHFVWFELRTLPPVHSLRRGIHDSPASSAT